MKLVLPVTLLLALAAGPALAATPGPAARQGLLPLGVCESGDFEGEACVDAGDCDDGTGASHVCSTPTLEFVARGFLTILSDKDSGRFESLDTVPYEVKGFCDLGPRRGLSCASDADCQVSGDTTSLCVDQTLPADFSKSTLTLILEFTKDGTRHVFAETYKDLGDYVDPSLNIDCRGFCVPTWREPAVEPRIADPDVSAGSGAGGGGGGGGGSGTGGGGGTVAGGSGIRIQWAQAPPAIARAMIRDLGLPEGSTPFLEVVDTVSIVDRSAEEDPLATVRTLKVTIRVVGPAAP